MKLPPSARLVLATLALLGVPPPAAAETRYDWCAPVVVRPDARFEDGCRPVWPPAAIAAGADVVLVGSGFEVSEPKIDPPERSCFGPATHRRQRDYVDQLRKLAAERSRKLTIVQMHRFDLVTPEMAAQPGFDATFLLRSDRSWEASQAFFASDASPVCRKGGCSLLERAPNDDRERSLAQWIDASAPAEKPSRHVVYYLARPAPDQREHWPIAAVADLRNPAYRRWRVEEARRAIAAGGYDAIELNQKFHQYRTLPGKEHWIGSGKAPDVTALDALVDTLFSAPPRAYGYPDYVAGWSALAEDLQAAGVPYTVSVNAAVWSGRYDDPATAERNESEAIRRVARAARLALLLRPGPRAFGALEAAQAEIAAGGGRSVPFDASCGYGKPTAAGSP